jgi:hypothetical protein
MGTWKNTADLGIIPKFKYNFFKVLTITVWFKSTIANQTFPPVLLKKRRKQ